MLLKAGEDLEAGDLLMYDPKDRSKKMVLKYNKNHPINKDEHIRFAGIVKSDQGSFSTNKIVVKSGAFVLVHTKGRIFVNTLQKSEFKTGEHITFDDKNKLISLCETTQKDTRTSIGIVIKAGSRDNLMLIEIDTECYQGLTNEHVDQELKTWFYDIIKKISFITKVRLDPLVNIEEMRKFQNIIKEKQCH